MPSTINTATSVVCIGSRRTAAQCHWDMASLHSRKEEEATDSSPFVNAKEQNQLINKQLLSTDLACFTTANGNFATKNFCYLDLPSKNYGLQK